MSSSTTLSQEPSVQFQTPAAPERWAVPGAAGVEKVAWSRPAVRRILPSPDRPHPWARRLLLLALDAVAMGAAVAAVLSAAAALGVRVPLWPVAVAAALCVAGYAAGRLYSSFPLSPVEEFRTLGVTTIAAFGTVAAATFEGSAGGVVLFGAVLVSGGIALSVVMSVRATARAAFGAMPWWGVPVVVLGDPEPANRVVATLHAQPELGVRPVATFYNDLANEEEAGRPLSHAVQFAAQHRIRDAVVVTSPSAVRDVAERYGYLFHRLLVIPQHDSGASLWVGARDVAGTLGFEVRHRGHARWRRALKRTLDLSLSLAVAVVGVPLGLVIAVLIRLDSPGPALYHQDRVGRGGRCFRVWKFRTMQVGAHDVLQEYLDRHPEAAAEYAAYAKLTHDPRVTRIGRVLRRTSLDELPQMINVLAGHMSLVGPRAYMPGELPRMNGRARTIARVLPGVTGLWQVSGRNHLTFEERIDLDRRYVQNWSLSLDLYLLARTVPTVLFGRGAQ